MTNLSNEEITKLFYNERFPRSSKYDGRWVADNQMGPNVLWLTEWLLEEMEITPGMRVLDLGCGKGLSSIFLARETGCRVWAADLWIKATENWNRVREAGLEDRVFPLNAEARSLPFPCEFFDAIVSLDSYNYYGTDALYLAYVLRFLKPGGRIGVVVPALMKEFPGGRVPERLTRLDENGDPFWLEECWSIETAEFWRTLWGRSLMVELENLETLPDGARHWLQHMEAVDAAGANIFPSETQVVREDGGEYLGFLRAVAKKKPGAMKYSQLFKHGL